MKVKELIEKLKEYPEDHDVIFWKNIVQNEPTDEETYTGWLSLESISDKYITPLDGIEETDSSSLYINLDFPSDSI